MNATPHIVLTHQQFIQACRDDIAQYLAPLMCELYAETDVEMYNDFTAFVKLCNATTPADAVHHMNHFYDRESMLMSLYLILTGNLTDSNGDHDGLPEMLRMYGIDIDTVQT